jgi:hypothetical protein
MKSLVISLFAACALLGVADANAHLMVVKNCTTVSCINDRQLQNLKHARYVCNNGAHQNKRWNCKAVKWLKREYTQTYAVLHPVRVTVSSHTGGYQGITVIRYARASCESGGNPYNKRNPKYRGKWQFDQSTWDAYAPAGYRGMDPANAPESIQDAAALAVTYDAWPNC